MPDVVMLRPMTSSDPAVCVEIFDQAFTEMRTRFCLPATNWTEQDARHQEQRFDGFLRTDPDGSWVAVDSDGILGFAQAIIRDNSLWMLSMLAVRPQHQSAGVGASLLAAALDYGESNLPRMVLCSCDPRATRRYASAGFDLHPAMTARGPVDPSGLPPADGVRRGDDSDMGMVAEIDRAVRGASRATDVIGLMVDGGADLFVAEDEGWVLMFNYRPYALASRTEDGARRLLSYALRRVPAGRVTEVGWLTASQRWAIDLALECSAGPASCRPILHPLAPGPVCASTGLWRLRLTDLLRGRP